MDKKSPCFFFYKKTGGMIASCPAFLYNNYGMYPLFWGVFCRRSALREPMRPPGCSYILYACLAFQPLAGFLFGVENFVRRCAKTLSLHTKSAIMKSVFHNPFPPRERVVH